MVSIDELRKQRKTAVRREAALTDEIKELDKVQRAKRGELDKVRKEARSLTSAITKLAKLEDEL